MKRGKEKMISILFILILMMTLIPLVSAGFFSDLWGKITGYDVKGVGVNITIASFSIVSVTPFPASLTLNSGPFSSSIIINFSVYDGAGTQYLNDSTVQANLSIGVSGEQKRTNTTCYRTAEVTPTYANYSCNVTMYWYDTNGTWSITAFLRDNNSNVASNTTQTFVVNLLTGFEMSPSNLTWPSMSAGAINQTSSNDPLTLNNTGNKQIGIQGYNTNISINATDLVGETTNSWKIFASNFSIGSTGNTGACSGATGNCLECDTSSSPARATAMAFATYINITSANLTKGNYTVRDNSTGQEQFFFCIRIVDTGLTAQSYSTLGNGSWVVQI